MQRMYVLSLPSQAVVAWLGLGSALIVLIVAALIVMASFGLRGQCSNVVELSHGLLGCGDLFDGNDGQRCVRVC